MDGSSWQQQNTQRREESLTHRHTQSPTHTHDRKEEKNKQQKGNEQARATVRHNSRTDNDTFSAARCVAPTEASITSTHTHTHAYILDARTSRQ